MQRVGTLIGDFARDTAQASSGPLALLAALALAADSAMQPLELLQAALERPGGWNHQAVRERGEHLDAQVHADRRPGILRHFALLLDVETDVPVSSLLRNRGGEKLDAHGGQIPMLLESQPAQAW